MNDHPIALITDSTCDIPEELIQQYGITVLPHRIIWGSDQYLDRIDLQPEDFYRRLASDPQYPSTAQVTVQEFADAFQKAKERGALEIIIATVSSAMSGAYQSALSAAGLVDIPVHVVDAKGPTMSLGWQILAAARALDVGETVQSVLAKMEQVRKNLAQFVAMDSVEYLHKGGRIGNAKFLLSSVLNIKPLVYIDHESGLVESAGVARTHNRLVQMMMEKFFSLLDSKKPMRVAVLHGNIEEEAQELAEQIQAEFNPLELIVNITGPVLGVNTGPRALALCGYNEA